VLRGGSTVASLKEVYQRLERLFGSVRRLELFARQRWPGWEAWGNELTPSDAVEALREQKRLQGALGEQIGDAGDGE